MSRVRVGLRRRLRRLGRKLAGREVGPRAEVSCETARYGTDYGGWSVCPRLLAPSAVVYSFGVGEDISWDLAMIERHRVEIWAFDPTPRSVAWVADQIVPPQFHFQPLAVADYDGTLTLHPPADPRHVSHSVIPAGRPGKGSIEVPARRIRTLQRELGHERIDLIKLDVEGAEYAVLEDLLRGVEPLPVQLLVEFHHHLPGVPSSASRRAVDALRSSGYAVFAVAESGREVSFLHRSALSGSAGWRPPAEAGDGG